VADGDDEIGPGGEVPGDDRDVTSDSEKQLLDYLRERRRMLKLYRKRQREEAASCLTGVLTLAVLGYFVGKAFR